MRATIIALALALALVLGFASAAGVAAQATYPASALIRGENIWLRAEPAEATAVVAYLQRGEPVTLTGPVESADGDRYYPVEVGRTGEAGWVRELFVAPDSIAPLGAAPGVVDVPAPDAAEPLGRTAAEGQREERAAARAAEREAAREAERAAQRETREAVPDPEPAANSGCDPSYPGVCIPPPPPDLDCGDVPYDNFAVRSPDPHGFDREGDGYGCE